MKMNLLTELICNVLLYSIGFGGLMVICAVAEGQLSLLPALAIGAVLCFTFNAVAGVRIALRNTNTQKRSVTIAPQPHTQSSTPPLRVMRGEVEQQCQKYEYQPHKAAPHPCALCAVGMPLKFCRRSLVVQRHCNPVRNVLLLY